MINTRQSKVVVDDAAVANVNKNSSSSATSRSPSLKRTAAKANVKPTVKAVSQREIPTKK